jgi:PAS domain S-box-containing protein
MKSTDEAQITEAFKQSETLFQVLIENSSDAIVLNNAEGYITYASPSIERLLGYPPDEFRTFHPSGLIHPDDRQAMAELFAALLEQRGKSVTTRYRVRHKNGSWR